MSFFIRSIARAAAAKPSIALAPRSIFQFQTRFLEIDPKLCFVDPVEVKDRLYELLKKFQAVDQEKLATIPTTSQFSDLGLDSLDTVEFLLTVEDEFKIEIHDDAAENIKTIDDAIKFVATHAPEQ